MTDLANSTGIGTGADATVDATLDLLDPTIRVSEVDHINEGVNRPVVYSVALLATMSEKHERLAKKWTNFLHSPEGVQIYVDGGFTALTGTEQAERYSFDAAGNLVIEQFTP